MQIDLLSGGQRLGKNDGDEIVLTPRPLCAFRRWVVNKFDCVSIGLDMVELEKSRQLEQESSLAAVMDLQVQPGFGFELRRRSYFGVYLVFINLDWVIASTVASVAGEVVRRLARRADRKRSPRVVITFIVDGAQLADSHLFRRLRVVNGVEGTQLAPTDSQMQKRITGMCCCETGRVR